MHDIVKPLPLAASRLLRHNPPNINIISLQSLKSLYSLKIKVFFDINIFISLAINLTLLSSLFSYLINISFPKNSVLSVYIFINLNALFVMITNKYKSYVNKVIFSFL